MGHWANVESFLPHFEGIDLSSRFCARKLHGEETRSRAAKGKQKQLELEPWLVELAQAAAKHDDMVHAIKNWFRDFDDQYVQSHYPSFSASEERLAEECFWAIWMLYSRNIGQNPDKLAALFVQRLGLKRSTDASKRPKKRRSSVSATDVTDEIRGPSKARKITPVKSRKETTTSALAPSSSHGFSSFRDLANAHTYVDIQSKNGIPVSGRWFLKPAKNSKSTTPNPDPSASTPMTPTPSHSAELHDLHNTALVSSHDNLSHEVSDEIDGEDDVPVIDIPVNASVATHEEVLPPISHQIEGIDIRPTLTARIPAWAKTRSDLCETLPYFKRFQGGVYSKNGTAEGYLLDGTPNKSEVFGSGGRVIISHGGGASETLRDGTGQGRVTLVKDQNLGQGNAKSLIHAFKRQQPMALIIGSHTTLFPYEFPRELQCRYAVLGWYFITHAWTISEPAGTGKRFNRNMFRFQYIEGQGDPWWDSSKLDSFATEKEKLHLCNICRQTTDVLPFKSPTCLNIRCPDFRQTPFETFSYSKNFLLPIETYSNIPCPTLTPIPPAPQQPLDVSTKQAWGGRHCIECGNLACRRGWDRWKCSHCRAEIVFPDRTTSRIFVKWLPDAALSTSVVQIKAPRLASFDAVRYKLEPNCYVLRLRPKSHDDADKVLGEYESADASKLFIRRQLKSSIVPGMLNRHFSFNSGQDYRYSSINDTLSFDASPACVRSALEILSKAASEVFAKYGKGHPTFNQVLSVAYMEDQGMKFHSDGEVGLGEIVGSLSLGSSASMKFRPMAKYHHSKDPELRALYAKNSSPKGMPKVVLTLGLHHGDIVFMSGGMQRTYEHGIEVEGYRFAATARYVSDAHHR